MIALFVTVTGLGVYHSFVKTEKTFKIEHLNTTPTQQAVFTLDEEGEVVPLDFTKTAEKVNDAVVHIKATQATRLASQNDYSSPFGDLFRGGPFGDFFGPNYRFRQMPGNRNQPPQMKMGSGSGVIISEDGYIVTNNHVVDGADDLEVTLYDNRSYKATIIGTDPTTDLALLRIDEEGLPTLPFVNSDEVKIGEWVMAVGNPFNLNSTVTAGIVSAKGRNINILREKYAVESFIQTDAAINPGNSGGALVNLQGGLIGINTAIASPTGAYSGYGFAVPANLVNKVVEDLMKYGVVQRGVLGITIRTVDGNLQKEKDLLVATGAYVDSLMENSAAGSAGIKPGDVIVEVEGNEIKSSPNLQEVIARHRPGDVVSVKVNRDGKEKEVKVTLNNPRGNTDLVEKEHQEALAILGADFETLDEKVAEKMDISGGVRVKQLYAGKLRRHTDMREGFVITKVDGKRVKSVEELAQVLANKKGGVMLEGVYEGLPGEHYYAFGI